jgi:hypothetical protein
VSWPFLKARPPATRLTLYQKSRNKRAVRKDEASNAAENAPQFPNRKPERLREQQPVKIASYSAAVVSAYSGAQANPAYYRNPKGDKDFPYDERTAEVCKSLRE